MTRPNYKNPQVNNRLSLLSMKKAFLVVLLTLVPSAYA